MWILKKKIKGKDVVVRRIKKQDLERYFLFYRERKPVPHEYLEDLKKICEAEINSKNIVIAEIKNKIIGYVYWEIAKSEILKSEQGPTTYCYIGVVWFLPEWRRKKIYLALQELQILNTKKIGAWNCYFEPEEFIDEKAMKNTIKNIVEDLNLKNKLLEGGQSVFWWIDEKDRRTEEEFARAVQESLRKFGWKLEKA